MTRRTYNAWVSASTVLAVVAVFLPPSLMLVVLCLAGGIAGRCAYERGDLKD